VENNQQMINRIFFFIISIFILFSCNSKKVVTEFKEVIKKDTLIITKDRLITKAFTDTLYVENPCDSITGDLKDFQRSINTNNAKIDLSSVKGKIRLSVNIDSLVNERVKEYKSNFKQDTEIKKEVTIRYRTPLWNWIVIGLLSLIIALLLKFK